VPMPTEGAHLRVLLSLANTGPDSGSTDAAEFLQLWKEIQAFFASGHTAPFIGSRDPEEWYVISLDATDVIDALGTRVGVDNEAAIDERLHARLAAGRPPLGGDIEIAIHAMGGHTARHPPFKLLGRFLQQLFLSANIAVPGSCNLFSCRYPEFPDAQPGPPHHNANILEFAYNHAHEVGWPPIGPLGFGDVWHWLHDVMIYDLDIAEHPLEKALFTLLRVCTPDAVETHNILEIAQVLESLFAEGRDNIGTILRHRIEAVLGIPRDNKKWFSRLYELRSRIAHGGVPLLRPGEYYEMGDNAIVEKHIAEYFAPADQATAVMLALLQDMAKARCRAYSFTQSVVRVT
jgi:hypothetical protein